MILDDIIAYKKREVEERKKHRPIIDKAPAPRGFLKKTGRTQLIAELKKASPSKGIIREDFNPAVLARECVEGGASALSVLTEEGFFQGRLEYIAEAKKTASVPILRKDFIIDEYQILESRAAGADAILLLACILKPKVIQKFLNLAYGLGLAALVEIHSEDELDFDARMIGINNRDLRTFKVDVKNTEKLISKIPRDKFIVSESGISNRQDVEYMESLGVDAVLVGEAIMASPDVGGKVRELCGLKSAG